MITSKRVPAALMAMAAVGASGCAAIDTAQQAYSTVRAGYGIDAALTTKNGIEDVVPAFAGFSAVVAAAELKPRNEKTAGPVTEAFQESLVHQIHQLAVAAKVPLQMCPSVQGCSGRVLSVQFREDAYDAHLVEKFVMRKKHKGKLSFIDAATGRIIGESRIEGAGDYPALLAGIRATLYGAMLKSYRPTSPVDWLDHVQAVKPGYEKVLSSS